MPYRKGSLLKKGPPYTGGFLQPFYPVFPSAGASAHTGGFCYGLAPVIGRGTFFLPISPCKDNPYTY